MKWSRRLRKHGGAAALAEKRRQQIVMLSQASTKAASEKLRAEARETLKWLHQSEMRSLTEEEIAFWKEQAA